MHTFTSGASAPDLTNTIAFISAQLAASLKQVGEARIAKMQAYHEGRAEAFQIAITALEGCSMSRKSTEATTATEVDELRAPIDLMDNLSQDGLSEITAIAKLALLSLESPDSYRHLDNIAHALKAIWSKANDTQDSINGEAERVGCNHVDKAERRRWDAQRIALSLAVEKMQKGGVTK